jgi:cell division septal protein FtsQ
MRPAPSRHYHHHRPATSRASKTPTKARKTATAKANRFVHSEPRDWKKLAWRWLWSLTAIAAVFFVLWLLSASSWLLIKNVQVNGNRNIPQESVLAIAESAQQGRVWGLFPRSNVVFFPFGAVRQELMSNFPLMATNLDYELWQHRLSINLMEKDYSYLWQEGTNYYYINREGEIIMSKQAPTPGYVILENTGPSLVEGKRVLVDPKYLDFAKSVDAGFKNYCKGLKLRTFVYDGSANTLKVKLTSGPVLIFNTEARVEDQLAKLESLRQTQFRDGAAFNSLQYIILRYGERVYVQ